MRSIAVACVALLIIVTQRSLRFLFIEVSFACEAALRKALKKLTEGAAPEAQCLVQERVEDVRCEMRAFCCKDEKNESYAMQLLNMRMKSPSMKHQVWDASFSLTDTHDDDLGGAFEVLWRQQDGGGRLRGK